MKIIEAFKAGGDAFFQTYAQPAMFRIDVKGQSHFAQGEDDLLDMIEDVEDPFTVYEEVPCDEYVQKLVRKRDKRARKEVLAAVRK